MGAKFPAQLLNGRIEIARCSVFRISSAIRSSQAFQLIAILIAGSAGCYAGSTVGPLQETLRTSLALTDTQTALLQGPALYLLPVVGTIPIGFLIDRFSRARLLAGFAAAEVLGTVLTAWAPTFIVLLLARALVGLMLYATAMNASTLVAGLVRPDRRGRALMALGIAQIVGMAAAFALGGKLLVLHGLGAQGWRWTMLWLAAPLVIVCGLTLWVRDPPGIGVALVEKRSLRSALMALWQYRAVMLPLAFGPVIVGMGYSAALVWAVPILSRKFNLAPDAAGSIMGISLLVSGILGPLLGGLLADFCQRTGGPRRTLSFMIGLAVLQIPSGFFGMMPSVVSFSALLIALSTLAYMKGIICTTLSSVVIPHNLLGLCLGTQNAIGSAFASVAPVAVSLLSGMPVWLPSIGVSLSLVCVLTSLLGATAFAFGRRHFPGPQSHVAAYQGSEATPPTS